MFSGFHEADRLDAALCSSWRATRPEISSMRSSRNGQEARLEPFRLDRRDRLRCADACDAFEQGGDRWRAPPPRDKAGAPKRRMPLPKHATATSASPCSASSDRLFVGALHQLDTHVGRLLWNCLITCGMSTRPRKFEMPTLSSPDPPMVTSLTCLSMRVRAASCSRAYEKNASPARVVASGTPRTSNLHRARARGRRGAR